ncbi:hypothetical protein Dsin_023704 [Dipteronia sinensis]|uniref:DUF4220 domain-containing protein n=1 Tax=Dipteronia sinensis TaxID=43782 RepID=A0AAE0E1B2_9ROSI|nr:hypothetical protein Dsin_023704 [Dipteronia sinensis]
MFVSGTIKYLERTRALYLASLDRFRDSMLKDPDPGPNYAKLMDEYASKKEAKHPAKIITIEEPVNSYGLIVDLIFSFHERDESRDFFGKLRQEDALRVIEVELNFIYEVFYTKIQVVRFVTGHISRFVSFSLVVVAFSLFHFKVKKNNFDHFDVKITYALFWGAIGLDTVSFFMLIFSDWTFAALRISSNDSKLLRKIKSSVASVLSWFLIFKKPRWYKCQNQDGFSYTFSVS